MYLYSLHVFTTLLIFLRFKSLNASFQDATGPFAWTLRSLMFIFLFLCVIYYELLLYQ
jgi:hypothetical protein